jgi:hypothetical protein
MQIAQGVLGGIGARFSAYQQIQQAKANKKIAGQQAALEVQRAEEARRRAAALIMERGEERRQAAGTALTAAAAAGVALDASPLDSAAMWERDQAALGAYENDKISRDAELQAWGFLNNARMLRYQGKAGLRAAKNNMIMTQFLGSSSEQSAASSVASSYSSYGATSASGYGSTAGTYSTGYGK